MNRDEKGRPPGTVIDFPRSESKDLVPARPNDMRLLDRVRWALRTRHYSPRTEKAYIGWIRQFILFHGKRHPEAMGEREIGAFLTHLATTRHLGSSTQNQALAALLFLYLEILGH